MENNKEKRVTTEKANNSADLIFQNMKLDVLYPWDDWWSEFIKPADSHPFMNLNDDRHNIKKLINTEFIARNLSNRLFVTWNIGIYMLDGETAVASKYFLGRVKKVANGVRTTITGCNELGMARGLILSDSRMLINVGGAVDVNLTLLAGAIGRMRSIPREVKRAALLHLGVEI